MLSRSGKNAQSTALGAQHLRVFARYASPSSSLRGVGEVSKATAKIQRNRPFCWAYIPNNPFG